MKSGSSTPGICVFVPVKTGPVAPLPPPEPPLELVPAPPLQAPPLAGIPPQPWSIPPLPPVFLLSRTRTSARSAHFGIRIGIGIRIRIRIGVGPRIRHRVVRQQAAATVFVRARAGEHQCEQTTPFHASKVDHSKSSTGR